MKPFRLSRRDMLEKCSAAGLLTVAAPLSGVRAAAFWAEGERLAHKPTPATVLGPFFKKSAPQSDALRRAGDPGIPLIVSGKIIGVRGEALPEARVDVWHADYLGHYDIAGYRFRGRLPLTSSGDYKYVTVMPGHYPDRVCQHIHYMISAPGHKTLVTQLYFATDSVFQGDPDKNFHKDPLITSRELVRPVTLIGDPKEVEAAVTFEICLEGV